MVKIKTKERAMKPQILKIKVDSPLHLLIMYKKL